MARGGSGVRNGSAGVRMVDAEPSARKIRETFQAKPVQKTYPMRFSWPRHVKFMGRGRAAIYWSDKWGSEDVYKHVAEATQDVYVANGYKIEDEHGTVHLPGRLFRVEDGMPRHFAILGECLGLQVTLQNGGTVQLEVPDAHWGAARHSDGNLILFLYDAGGIRFMIVGDELDVEKDGIVG
jgi:hypothetical protein